MIRIYLDWNVISNLKREAFLELKTFIKENKNHFQFPYSPAHFNDLMKSYSKKNDLFWEDLNYLEYLSENHLLRWENNRTMPLLATPTEYFEGIKDTYADDVYERLDIEEIFNEIDNGLTEFGFDKISDKIIEELKSKPTEIKLNTENEIVIKKMFPNLTNNSNMWDLMKDIFPFAHNLITDKDYYKDFRKSIGESGFRLETNSANWNEEEVVDKIDDYMSNFGVEMDFLEYVKASLRHMKKDINRYDIFTTAYLMLDMMGYKSDRLRKPADNMQNIQKDGEHAFYGAHCDYFITIDKNLKKKAKVLYSKFNISTKVFTPEEMINTLENVIHKKTININEFFKDILYYASQGTVFESHLLSDDNDIETYIIKLQIYFFNFFNYLIYNHYPNKNIIVIRFKKESFNYSDFNFYSEIDTLFTKLVSVFGYSSDDSVEKEFKMKKDEFIYKNTNNSFTWNFADAQVNLDKDPETHSPVLTCRIFLNKRKINEG